MTSSGNVNRGFPFPFFDLDFILSCLSMMALRCSGPKPIHEKIYTPISITQIAKTLNDEKIPTRNHPEGGWRTSTIARILKDEKYIGRYTWNKTKTLKDPMSGKRKQVPRPKQEWVIQDRPAMRIVPDSLWHQVQTRWAAIDKTYPTQQGKPGLTGQQKSYVSTHPPHLLSGALRCGECGGSMSLVSGKSGGYYGCLNAVRHTCTNAMLIARKKLEKQFIRALSQEIFSPNMLQLVFQKTAQKIAEQFAFLPNELRLKRMELQQTERRIHNFIECIAQGRTTNALTQALEKEETKATKLRWEVKSLKAASEQAFQPPSNAWIQRRLDDLQSLLEQRTSQSALAVRKLTGSITLTPKKPKQGRRYFQASCKFKSFALLDPDTSEPSVTGGRDPPEDNGSISYTWWNSTPRYQTSRKLRVRTHLLPFASSCWTTTVDTPTPRGISSDVLFSNVRWRGIPSPGVDDRALCGPSMRRRAA